MNYTVISDYYLNHRSEICAFVSARIGNEDVAEDVVQTVFERLLCSDKMITGITLPALVYKVARNLIYDYWRHYRHVEEYEHRIMKTVSAPNCTEDFEVVYSAKEISEILERGIARLTSRQREVYQLNIYDGLKVSEISKSLNLNYKSMENLLGAARKSVRQYVGCKWHSEASQWVCVAI